MELKQLQYFLAVAERLNFSRAAESLYISQSNLSHQIAELERELGAPLFVRDRRRVYLTAAGGAILPMARKILASTQELRNLVQMDFSNQMSRVPLRIGLDRTEEHFESTGITELLAGFQSKYPAVPLELSQREFDRCVADLRGDKLDLAFLILRHNETLPSLLDCKVVHRDRLVLVLKRDSGVTSCEQALEKYALVAVTDKPRGYSRVARCFGNMGLKPTVLQVDSIPVAFTYVQAGKGAIFLPENYFRLHRYPDLMALDINDSGAELTYQMVWNRASRNASLPLLIHSFPDAE